MNPIGLAAVLRLPGIAPWHPDAAWSLSWSHLPASAPTEPNAAGVEDGKIGYIFVLQSLRNPSDNAEQSLPKSQR